MELAGTRIFDPCDAREIRPVDESQVRRVVDNVIADFEADRDFREMRRMMLHNQGVRL